MQQKSIINSIFTTKSKELEILKSIFLILSGTVFISLMAQLKITLPFTPIPITGGTFAVLLVGLAYGKKLAPATLLTYIAAGTFGLPVFANFKSGSLLSASGGYIIGYLVAAFICGYFADKGWTKSYIKTIFVLLLATIAIYTFGLIQLSIFVPNKNVFVIGLIPFIPGDIIKIVAVTLLLPTTWKFLEK